MPATKTMKRFLCLAFFLLLASISGATDFKKLASTLVAYDDWDAVALPESINFEQAKIASDKGDSYARFVLGMQSYLGLGKEKNYQDAVMNFTISAFAHNEYAMYGLGLCLRDGKGIEKNKKSAAEYFEASSKAGFARAKNALGVMLYKGDGVSKDLQRAISLFNSAIADGIERAKVSLGYAYLEGKGVKKDVIKARE